MGELADVLWFSPREDEQAEARGICRGCPARQECYVDALERHEDHGIWGGASFPGAARRARRLAAEAAAMTQGAAA